MKNLTLTFTEDQWSKLRASKAIKSHLSADTLEEYCVNILTDRADSLLEAPGYNDLICPHCHQSTKFQWLCDKCNKVFFESKSAED